MFSNRSRAALAVVGFFALFHVASADASTVVLPFPGTGTLYTSATDGSGLIPAGGASAVMYTAGDNVDQTFSGTGVTSVNSLKVDFNVDNNLNGSSETVDVAINGITVGSFTVPDGGGSGGVINYAVSVFFAPIIGNGTYDLTMTLQDTIPAGEGSIDFRDGGVFVLNGGVRTAAPEPVTLLLFGAGLAGVTSLSRRKERRP
jgi:PEP-CTERM motif